MLRAASKIVISQDPQEWGRHNNGGDYGFSQIYTRNAPGEDFEIEHRTTADIDFCHVYGVFQPCRNCRDWDEKDGCCAEPEKVSEQELGKILEEACNSADEKVYGAIMEEFVTAGD
jgi:hypothetical protein